MNPYPTVSHCVPDTVCVCVPPYGDTDTQPHDHVCVRVREGKGPVALREALAELIESWNE